KPTNAWRVPACGPSAGFKKEWLMLSRSPILTNRSFYEPYHRSVPIPLTAGCRSRLTRNRAWSVPDGEAAYTAVAARHVLRPEGRTSLDLRAREKGPLRVCAVKRRHSPVGARPTRRIAPAGSNRSSHGGNEMTYMSSTESR